MSYSCCDFVDDILSALKVDVPEKDWDNPSGQADLALEKIQAYRDLAINIRALDDHALAHMSLDALRATR
jgi:hypothetical protein